jgi:hypothetical protein
MAYVNRIVAVPLTSILSSAVSGTYAVINSGGLPSGCAIVRITNNSDQDVTISYDGTTDHDFALKSGGQINLNFQSNSSPNNNQAYMAQGTKVYVKGTAGSGSIYLSAYYQPQL